MVLKRPCGMCVGRACVLRDLSCWVNTTEIPSSSRKKGPCSAIPLILYVGFLFPLSKLPEHGLFAFSTG